MTTAQKLAAALALALAGTAAPAYAADCAFEGKAADLEEADVDRLYECIKAPLAEGYAKEGDEVAKAYRSWGITATRAAAPGAHSNRLLITFANDVAFDDYMLFREDGGFSMPVGSILAKESFSVSKKGKPRKGPFFTMTKVAAGEADEYANWVYGALLPNGKIMKIKQSFCHDCHAAFEDQDFLGYPDTDVRLVVE